MAKIMRPPGLTKRIDKQFLQKLYWFLIHLEKFESWQSKDLNKLIMELRREYPKVWE